MSYSASNARQDLAWLLERGAVTEWCQVETDPALFELLPAGARRPVRLSAVEVRVFWRGVLAGRRAETVRRVPRIGVG